MRSEERARELILAGDDEPLVNYETLGRNAHLSIPTPEHYLPLLYVLALRREKDRVGVPVEGFDGGSVSMLSVKIGWALNRPADLLFEQKVSDVWVF